jgi:type VI secretion system secreted protein VgrG
MSLIQLTTEAGLAFDVREFAIAEALNQPFVIETTAHHPDHDIDFARVVGKAARFVLESGRLHAHSGTRVWNGVVRQLELIKSEPAGTGTSTWAVTVAPRLWLLTQRRNYRIFQFLSEVGVAVKLLEEWQIDHRLALDPREYPARKYKVQYGESDYAFFARILEEVGITWFFEDDGQTTRLVLTDRPQAADIRPPIAFEDAPMEAAERDSVTQLHIHGRVRPNKYTVCDHDFRRPSEYRLEESAAADGADCDVELERYQYWPGSFLFDSALGEDTPVSDDRGKTRTVTALGKRLAERRLLAKRATGKRMSFETNCLDLRPGVVMTILGHPRAAVNVPNAHLVTLFRMFGSASGAWSAACETTDAAVPFFPPITVRKPKVVGVECATVVGASGDEVATDEFGRVRVQFHWDREGKRNEESSCWIHVSQPWAGAGMGSISLPRVGQEVLVEFLGGDPDRPIITGRVYTNLQKVPYKLPESKTVTVIAKTRTLGGDGFNEIKADDKPGGELLSMQAERDLSVLVKRDARITVGQDAFLDVKRNQNTTVGDTWKFDAKPPPNTPNPWPSGFTWNNRDGLEIKIGTSVIKVQPGAIYINADYIAIDGKNGLGLYSAAAGIDIKASGTVDVKATKGALSLDGGPDVKLNCK